MLIAAAYIMEYTPRGSRPDPKSPTGWAPPSRLLTRRNLFFQLNILYGSLVFSSVFPLRWVRRLICRGPLWLVVYTIISQISETILNILLLGVVETVRVERKVVVEKLPIASDVLGGFGNKLL